jgi:hypothetical protein
MQHCVEIEVEDFRARDPGAYYFYISTSNLNLLRRLAKQNREWN